MATLNMIDIAVNLTDNMFKGVYNGKQCHFDDIQTVLTRAWAAGVDRIIVTGGSLQESKEALAIAETDARFFCTVGVHPTRCKEFTDSGDPEKYFQELVSLAKEGLEKGKVVAIGECGLDYDRLHFFPCISTSFQADFQGRIHAEISVNISTDVVRISVIFHADFSVDFSHVSWQLRQDFREDFTAKVRADFMLSAWMSAWMSE